MAILSCSETFASTLVYKGDVILGEESIKSGLKCVEQEISPVLQQDSHSRDALQAALVKCLCPPIRSTYGVGSA